MKKFLHLMLIAPLLLSLAACAVTREKSMERMNSFVGQTEAAVIDSWGVPDKTYEMSDKTKVIAYREEREHYDSPGSTVCLGSYPGPFGYSMCGGGGPKRIKKLACEYSFHLKGGVVTEWSQHGNNCPVKE